MALAWWVNPKPHICPPGSPELQTAPCSTQKHILGISFTCDLEGRACRHAWALHGTAVHRAAALLVAAIHGAWCVCLAGAQDRVMGCYQDNLVLNCRELGGIGSFSRGQQGALRAGLPAVRPSCLFEASALQCAACPLRPKKVFLATTQCQGNHSRGMQAILRGTGLPGRFGIRRSRQGCPSADAIHHPALTAAHRACKAHWLQLPPSRSIDETLGQPAGPCMARPHDCTGLGVLVVPLTVPVATPRHKLSPVSGPAEMGPCLLPASN